jgi:hypothetical protein
MPLRNEHKVIAGTVPANDKCIRRKPTPTTRNLRFTQDVIRGSRDSLPITVIKYWVQLPGIPSRLDLTAILRAQAGMSPSLSRDRPTSAKPPQMPMTRTCWSFVETSASPTFT